MTTEALPSEYVLSTEQQTRNIIVFSVCSCLQYLAAPVLYVGLTQAALCNELKASRVVANLPEIMFFLMTGVPVLLAWCLPSVTFLMRLMAACYLLAGLATGLVAASLILAVPDEVKIGSIVLQGAISGATIPTVNALLWEAVGRGVDESRRGIAFSLAFGVGPFLAFGASLAAQRLLAGTYPWNFVTLFGTAIPLMFAAAMVSLLLVIPETREERNIREPFFAGLLELLATPVLARATIVTVLLCLGNTITTNMSLYTTYALGADPTAYAGYQNALRFFCKGIVGLFLGWTLARSTPRAGVLITAALLVSSQLWAIGVPGTAYLFAFGLYGAGELVGAYAPNYILSASAPHRIRQNMAYVTLMMLPAAPAGYLFGTIAQRGSTDPGAGLRMSFIACAGFLILGFILAVLLLPPRPNRQTSAENGET